METITTNEDKSKAGQRGKKKSVKLIQGKIKTKSKYKNHVFQ
jgi:hypothetical protein